MIERYTKLTHEPLKGVHFSGTIYPPSLINEPLSAKAPIPDSPAQKLEYLYTLAFQRSYLWNSLHADEFPAGAAIEHQVVQMVAESFGADPEKTMGYVTSGGTESIMSAARSYRNWGMEKGHSSGQSVMIAPDSIHASLMKAAVDYNINLVLIPTDSAGRLDLKKLESALKRHGSDVVAIFGSAPAYPKGVVDPIEEMASLAKRHGCGMHVDCCLGGFLINFQSERSGSNPAL